MKMIWKCFLSEICFYYNMHVTHVWNNYWENNDISDEESSSRQNKIKICCQ